MAIDGGLRKNLAAGTKLLVRYKGEQHTAAVVSGEDGKIRFRLADGREFKSPSAVGSAVMGGVACNGWRFWSLGGGESAEAAGPAGEGTAATAEVEDGATPKARPQCARCAKQFVGAAQLAHHEANADRLCIPA
jgi:Restriction Enzyme Adenine Methylase Associated